MKHLTPAISMILVLLHGAGNAQTTAPTVRPDLPTLWIVGDSTVRNSNRGQLGWGAPIEKLFDTGRINVVNRARGGRSSRTFQTEGMWQQVLDEAKPGDFVLIQFGHNDGAPIDDAKARGSIRGLGDEAREIDNPATKQKEVVHTYGWYMRKYVTDAKAKGMTPIICSLVPRVPREPVVLPVQKRDMYVDWAASVAKAQEAAYIDLNQLVLEKYATLSPEKIKEDYFTEADNTHTNAAGAELNAACVVEGLRQLEDCSLKSFLK